MPDYNIFVLEEDLISLSGGAVLDGVTQGDGTHLTPSPPTPPITLTLNSNAWTEVEITDNDPDFQDSDSSQTLLQPTTLNGTTYGIGSVVEAEYGITVSDGTNTWTLVGFNVNDSSPAYGTVEGLAFIGGPGGFPPIGVPLTITSTFEGPNFQATEYATPICLADGTRIRTPAGPVAIEDVVAGDIVLTRDHGPQIVRWHGTRRVRCMSGFAPVRFAKGAIGNTGTLTVSQQHRVLISGWQAELLFGQDEVLVPAVHLVNDCTVRLVREGWVTYHHLLLDRHVLLETEGAWTESLHLGQGAMASLLPRARQELTVLFPEALGSAARAHAALGYPELRGREAALLNV